MISNFFHDRVSRVFQTRKNYGFALGRRLSTSSMYKLLKEFGEKNEDYVAALVESKTSSPHVSDRFLFLLFNALATE